MKDNGEMGGPINKQKAEISRGNEEYERVGVGGGVGVYLT